MFIKIEKLFLSLAHVFSKNKIFQILHKALEKTLPILTIGCIFLFLGQMPFSIVNDFFISMVGSQWTNICLNIAGVCFYLSGFIVTIFIALYYADYLNVNKWFSLFISIGGFIYLVFDKVFIIYQSFISNGLLLQGISKQSFQYIGHDSMIFGIVGSFIFVRIYSLTVQYPYIYNALHKCKLFIDSKTNKTMSLKVVSFLNYCFISCIIVGLVYLISMALIQFTISDVEMIAVQSIDATTSYDFSLLSTNIVTNLIQSITTFFSVCLLELSEIVTLAGSAFNAQNLQAFQTGLVLPNTINGLFITFFGTFGGFGSTLSLVLVMLLIGKSDRIKKVARYSIVPGIFGMNITLLYGLPIFLNPILLIPFILVPVVNLVLSYGATVIGLLPVALGNEMLWTMPIGFSGFLATGSVSAVLWQLFLLFIGCCIYFPFIRVLDKNYLKVDVNNLLDEELIVE